MYKAKKIEGKCRTIICEFFLKVTIHFLGKCDEDDDKVINGEKLS